MSIIRKKSNQEAFYGLKAWVDWLFDRTIMNRRKFLKAMGVASTVAMRGESCLTAGDTAPVATAVPAANSKLVDGTPAVYAPTGTGATIVWTLTAPARGWVEYGETKDLGLVCRSDSFGFVPHGERVLRVRLRGLKPGASYWWRSVTVALSGGEPELSPIYTFQTLNSAAAETRFAVWNDTHDHTETLRKLSELTRTEPADFLIWNGDVSNNVDKTELIPGLYVHPAGANLSEGPPILFSRGNHDVRGLWANQIPDYIDFPAGRSFYAFRSGPLAAIVLDTGEDKPDRHPTFHGMAAFEPLIEEQKQWLAQVTQLPEMKSAPFRLMFCHIPLRWSIEKAVDYDNGGFDWFSRRGRDAWHDALMAWGVQAIISGHMHSWGYLPGTAEFPYDQIVGGGPEIANATLMRGMVTEREMKIMIRALDGKMLQEVSYQPRKV